MTRLLTQLAGNHRRLVVCLLLIAASVACGGLVFARAMATDTYRYLFLLWNLFLAWVPFGASLLAYELHRRNTGGILLLGIGLFWLLFFPNAPYIVSDFVHLQNHGAMPERFLFWYDLVMISCFSWTALLLGFVSLYLMQSIVRSVFRDSGGTFISWIFVAAVMVLGGFGVYLGRFQRWNSWDILNRPLELLSTILKQVVHPFDHPQTWGITILFAAMMSLLYMLLYGFVEFSRAKRSEAEGEWKKTNGLVVTSFDQ